jgi:hypothetical protein
MPFTQVVEQIAALELAQRRARQLMVVRAQPAAYIARLTATATFAYLLALLGPNEC